MAEGNINDIIVKTIMDNIKITFTVTSQYQTNRKDKGKSILELPSDYTVIDIETTGLDPQYDEIIELSAMKVKSDIAADTFSTLCRVEKIDPFITELTGITNDMVKNAPEIKEGLESFVSFVGDSTVIGHNVNFDINFIYDNCLNALEKPFYNDFVDTLRLARKVCTSLEHHRLSDVLKYYDIQLEQKHRGLSDCVATHKIYVKLKETIVNNNIILKRTFSKTDLRDIKSENENFDETHPCYKKYFVFTGALKIKREEAAQLVVNLGGIAENDVTKKTNYLVLGNYDYNKMIKDGKSRKYKKAEEYILAGKDLQIITENVFFDMLL
jgi:DNA polymerase-3 subunit epsilon